MRLWLARRRCTAASRGCSASDHFPIATTVPVAALATDSAFNTIHVATAVPIAAPATVSTVNTVFVGATVPCRGSCRKQLSFRCCRCSFSPRYGGVRAATLY